MESKEKEDLKELAVHPVLRVNLEALEIQDPPVPQEKLALLA